MMNKWIWRFSVIMALLLTGTMGALAQTSVTEATELPSAWRLRNVRFEAQKWNNCGPATITNALSYFGYSNNQDRAANWLKPNTEDKNVSPWQMADFVNTQVSDVDARAALRVGGNMDLMKLLLVNNFPVIIEKGYDPEPQRLGWMGHYLLLTGYDDTAGVFITHDSYIGADTNYDYEYINRFWQHFNYTYIVLYPSAREEALMELLGDDADPQANFVNAFYIAQQEATSNPDDPFAWFNMGTNLVELELYEDAARAYDAARNRGLPWRMMWYQFGPFEAYYQVERYDDMIVLAQANLNDGGGQFVEETYYYGGLAREGRGELDRAMSNFAEAIRFNPNFTPALEAQQRLQGTASN